MTTEQEDLLVGRVLREAKDAEDNLMRLLVQATVLANDIASLSKEIHTRVANARAAGTRTGVFVTADAGIESGHLERYTKAVDLAAIDALDKEIGLAVAKARDLREQKKALPL